MMCFPSALAPWTADLRVGSTTETYTSDAAAEASVVAAMDALVAWASDPARGWSAQFAWSWQVGAGGAVRLVLSANAGFRFDDAPTDLGFAVTGVNATELVAASAASGCWGCLSADRLGRLNLRLAYRFLSAAGDAAGVGAARAGVPGTAAIKPSLEAVTDPSGLAALDALLRATSGDRTIIVWDTISRSWLTLRLGPVNRSPAGKSLYRLTFDVRGT